MYQVTQKIGFTKGKFEISRELLVLNNKHNVYCFIDLSPILIEGQTQRVNSSEEHPLYN